MKRLLASLTRKDALCALGSGGALVLSSPPMQLVPMVFVSAWLLCEAVRGARPGRAFFLGWLAAFVAQCAGFVWTIELLVRFAHLPAVFAFALYLLQCAAQALVWGVAALGASWATPLPRWLRLPIALVVAEMVVPSLFPWSLGSQLVGSLWLAQSADLLGGLFLSFVVLLVGAWMTESRLRRSLAPAAAASALVVCMAGYGVLRIRAIDRARGRAPVLRVGIVQPNIGIDEKFDPRLAASQLERLHAMSESLAARGAELVVWPESAYPYSIRRDLRRDGQRMPPIRRGPGPPTIAGALTFDAAPSRRFYNSAVLVRADGTLAGPADKVDLVLFSERIPFLDALPFLREMFPRADSFTAGRPPQILADGRLRAGVLNCYEDMIRRNGLGLLAGRPNLLVNVTNDAWFGDTWEPIQHFEYGRLRSIELRRDMVRSVNTGLSGIVDAAGRVRARTRLGEQTTVLASVRLLDRNSPFGVVGDLFGYASAAVLGGAFIARIATRIARRARARFSSR